MTDRDSTRLLDYLIGGLDEPERRSLERRLTCDPALRREMADLRESLQPLAAARSAFMATPPAGLAARTCRMIASLPPPGPRNTPPREPASPIQRTPPGNPAQRTRPNTNGFWTCLNLAAAACIVALATAIVAPAARNAWLDAQAAAGPESVHGPEIRLVQHAAQIPLDASQRPASESR